MTKFRDKLTGEVIDVGNAQGEEAWKQLEFKVGSQGEQAPLLRTFRFKDKETGKEISALGHSEDEALRVIEEGHHSNIPDKHYTLLEALLAAPGSAPKSAKDVAVSTAQPFMYPKETAKAFKNLTYGILQMTGMKEGDEYVPYAQAVGKYLDQRYGSWENVKRTLAQDPVGLLADISIVIPYSAPEALTVRAAALPGKVARFGVDFSKGIAATEAPQVIKAAAKKYPLTAAAIKSASGTPGKVGAAIVGAPYAASIAGKAAGVAMAHWPITALAVLGYSKAAQDIAGKTVRTMQKVTPAPYAAGRIKEQQPTEMGGPEGGQRQFVNRKDKEEPARTRITVAPGKPETPTYGGPQ